MRMVSATLSFLVVCGSVSVVAQGAQVHMATGPAGLKWGPAPPALPTGAQIVVLSGDPTKSAPYVIRLKIPAGYQIPAHHHPTAEKLPFCRGASMLGWGTSWTRRMQRLLSPADSRRCRRT